MDESVPRRSFVRHVATDAVHTAGRLAALSGAATGIVTDGMLSLAGLGTDPDAEDAGSAERSSSPGAAPTPGTPTGPALAMRRETPTAPNPGRLDASTHELLAAGTGWSIAVNRPTAGPLILPVTLRADDDGIRIRSRAGSALALAVLADGHVTLLHDDAAQRTRTLLFGTAHVTEGVGLDDTPDPDLARISVVPGHAIRMPL